MTELAFPPAPPGRPAPRLLSPALVGWIVVAVLGLGVAVAQVGIVFFAYRDYQVPGAAMNPTLKPGGSALVRARDGEDVHRGDVVMFDRGAFAHPDSSGRSVFRVVAVGGDVVACCTGGALTVDGKAITETYLSQDQYAHDAAATTPYLVRLHEGQVFLLGDERGRARDSRFLGVVPVSAVTGFVVGTGRISRPAPLARTTAFTDAGLPGAPFEDTLYTALRWWLLGGVVLLFAGVTGMVVTLVRRAGRRRRAAAGPPGR
ncbi:signal peptidase I [Amycolatopsis sp. NPDC004625]|uniref:signal peptidase I n=1 Tax=Amycolatopsis sp. NPDC004625 TaxID=3154670 RepID=UPI0033A47DB1